MPKHNEVSPRVAQMCSVITCVQDASIKLKVMITWPSIFSWQQAKCYIFLFVSSQVPVGFVLYLWKMYGDELLTDFCMSTKWAYLSKSSLILCNLKVIQWNDTLLHLLPHSDGLACQTVLQPWRECKTHTDSQALWHLKKDVCEHLNVSLQASCMHK